MRRRDLERLVLDKPQVGLKVMSVLSERLSLVEDRMEDIALKEVPARLASFILQLVESEGVMTSEGRRIHVRDIEALKKVASEGLHPTPVS